MAVEKINIDQFLGLAKNHLVIDVRSPGEYQHAHIPGAYSLPLFTDEERAAVGTAYKQESREKAIRIGLDFFGPKMKKMVEEVEGIDEVRSITYRPAASEELKLHTSKIVLIYCWRGGMRSSAVAWLLDLYGLKVFTLIGGYKKFRNYVLETFKQPFNFKILGGYTGSGKTETLKELERAGEKIVDLEGLANHKGSAFGNIGLPQQPTQEMFENLLSCELQQKLMVKGQWPFYNSESPHSLFTINHSAIWLEDESQRIGLINIPNELWNTMRNSPLYFLEIPFEERLNHLVDEYGTLEKEKMIDAIGRIKERLGGLEAKNAILHLESNEFRAGFHILLKYYDKWYTKGLHNRKSLNSLLRIIDCESVTALNAKKLIQQPVYHEKS